MPCVVYLPAAFACCRTKAAIPSFRSDIRVGRPTGGLPVSEAGRSRLPGQAAAPAGAAQHMDPRVVAPGVCSNLSCMRPYLCRRYFVDICGQRSDGLTQLPALSSRLFSHVQQSRMQHRFFPCCRPSMRLVVGPPLGRRRWHTPSASPPASAAATAPKCTPAELFWPCIVGSAA